MYLCRVGVGIPERRDFGTGMPVLRGSLPAPAEDGEDPAIQTTFRIVSVRMRSWTHRVA